MKDVNELLRARKALENFAFRSNNFTNVSLLGCKGDNLHIGYNAGELDVTIGDVVIDVPENIKLAFCELIGIISTEKMRVDKKLDAINELLNSD